MKLALTVALSAALIAAMPVVAAENDEVEEEIEEVVVTASRITDAPLSYAELWSQFEPISGLSYAELLASDQIGDGFNAACESAMRDLISAGVTGAAFAGAAAQCRRMKSPKRNTQCLMAVAAVAAACGHAASDD